MVVSNVCVSLVGNLLHATLLAPGIFRVLLGFWKIYASLFWKFTAVFLSNRKSPSLTYLLTGLLNLWSRVLLEKLTGSQLVKKFPAFCGTRSFVTAYTNARRLSLY